MDLIQTWSHNAFGLAALAYLAGLLLTWAPRPWPASLALVLGLGANLASLGLKLYISWPMQAPHQEPYWLVAGLAGLALAYWPRRWPALGRLLMAATVLLAAVEVLCPKDYYLPFPRSNTILAHVYLVFSAGGRATLWAGGLAAGLFLWDRTGADDKAARARFTNLHIWGFVLYTLSLFTAEAWSYLGWSSPVIWEDPAMTSTMATWFFYAGFLHLYLLRGWDARRRAWFGLAGPPLLFYFNYLSETGQFQWPGWGS
ncbi:MAG: cytochrome c biogenesis protein CcsA [Pseudomonadota bacterium]